MNDEQNRFYQRAEVRFKLYAMQLDLTWCALVVKSALSGDAVDSIVDLHGHAPSDVLETSMASFLMYMTASDGVIHDNEVEFFNRLLGYDSTPESIKECIIENNIYSIEYESKLPQIGELVVAMDLLMIAHDEVSDSTLLESLTELYWFVGTAIAKCDGEFSSSEKRELEIYLGMLQEKGEVLTKSVFSQTKVGER